MKTKSTFKPTQDTEVNQMVSDYLIRQEWHKNTKTNERTRKTK